MEVLNKKWVVDSDLCYILTVDNEFVLDYIRLGEELAEHYVSLHNKHIDDIMALKMMRDKLCDTSGGG